MPQGVPIKKSTQCVAIWPGMPQYGEAPEMAQFFTTDFMTPKQRLDRALQIRAALTDQALSAPPRLNFGGPARVACGASPAMGGSRWAGSCLLPMGKAMANP